MRREKVRRVKQLESRNAERPKVVIVRVIIEPSPDGPITTGAIDRQGKLIDRQPGESFDALKARALA